MRRALVFALALLLMGLSVPWAGLAQHADAAAPQPVEECGDRPLHPPIEIGNWFGLAGFVVARDPQNGEPTYRPGSGIVGGNGTAEDPYLIEGWCIHGGPVRTLRYGIRLIDTNAHVVIRDNVIGSTRAGVQLDNATNVIVEQNVLWGNNEGVALERTNGSVVRENVISDTRWGAISLDGSDANLILDNRIEGGREGTGIGLSWSQDNEVRGNVISGVAANAFSYTEGGITDSFGRRNLIAGNLVTDNGAVGIRLHRVEHTIVEDNVVARNSVGVVAEDSLTPVVRNNLVEEHAGNGFEIRWWRGGLQILDNVIRGNAGAGIRLDTDAWPHLDDIVRGNNVERNAGEGLFNWYDEIVDARDNWWGCAAGPDDAACDAVVGAGITYDPWLEEPNPNAGVRT